MKRIFRKELWQKIGQANADFTLVEQGDHIAIGLSGGKDSSTLVYVMSQWQRFSPVDFKITAVTLDMGWGGDLSPLISSFEGRIDTFRPKTYLDRKDITLIRPMIYVEERTIVSIVDTLRLPVVHNPCPANGCTKRQEMKGVMDCWEKSCPGLRGKLLSALRKGTVWQNN